MRCLLYSLLIMFLFQSCFDASIGNGYYLSSDKDYGSNMLVYEYADNANRNPSITRIDTLDNHVTEIIDTCTRNGCVVIGQHIVELENDDSFILVKQKPKDKFYAQDSLYRDFHESYILFRDSFNVFDYWIVDKRINNIYGPLSIEDYRNYRNRLQIPNNLKLKSE